jgi:hypothetical protein
MGFEANGYRGLTVPSPGRGREGSASSFVSPAHRNLDLWNADNNNKIEAKRVCYAQEKKLHT